MKNIGWRGICIELVALLGGIIEMASACVSSSSSLVLHGPPWLIRKVNWLLPDGGYYPRAVITKTIGHLVSVLFRRELRCIDKAVIDVAEQLSEIVQQEIVSHIVIYGSNRRLVAASMLSSDALPANIKLVLSEGEMQRESLIGAAIGYRLPPDTIKNLPEIQDPNDLKGVYVSEDLCNSLYSANRLVGPYQVDTDRYPFTNRFV